MDLFGRAWLWSGRARDDYVRVVSDWKWPLKKTGNCPLQSKIKAFFV